MPIEKSSQTVFTPLDDGTAVLLNLETLVYYSLNRTGAFIWQHIEESKTVDNLDLCDRICERFDVDEETAIRSVKSFVERLQEFKMIRTS